MKLREVVIRNFRCLAEVTVPLSDTTVLVGENNSGKTALLDALKLALPRTTPRTGTFDEYDYHMSQAGDSPQTSPGIVIDLWFREDTEDEWPDPLRQALDPIIQTDPIKNLNSIGLRVTSKFDEAAKEIVTKWEFINIEGTPLGGKGAAPANVTKFLAYVRLFYLSALRDSDDEFSPRSQFWGRILRDLKISPEQREALQGELAKLNASLLVADPRLERVRTALENLRKVLTVGAGQNISIQALPLQPWDLMSKAQLVIRSAGTELDFPLHRHGQGMQSLAVLFLFQAYIDVLLKPTFEPETEALLALEEPEAHLHPQAARALAACIGELKSQKILSSHSPYFVQEIPFTQIRMFRHTGATSKVLYVKQVFTARIPQSLDLITFCNNNPQRFAYHTGTQTLSIRGKMTQKEYRDILTIYAKQKEVHPGIKRLYEESQLFLGNAELADLDTYAKRIRGEVLFARAWLLCEGQSEYLLLRYFAELLGTPLDQLGITVIDFQNNGSPGTFVGLAKAFEIPWIMVCDNDAAGAKFADEVRGRGLTPQEVNDLARLIPDANADLETFLTKKGFAAEYEEILAERQVALTKKPAEAGYEDEVAENIKKDKTGAMLRLIEKLRTKNADAKRVPAFFATLIKDVIAKAG